MSDAVQIGIIGGSHSGLNSPEGVAVDRKGAIYVANSGGNNITVYAADVNGDRAPSRIIGGASTGLGGPRAIALDSVGEIYVANANSVR